MKKIKKNVFLAISAHISKALDKFNAKWDKVELLIEKKLSKLGFSNGINKISSYNHAWRAVPIALVVVASVFIGSRIINTHAITKIAECDTVVADGEGKCAEGDTSRGWTWPTPKEVLSKIKSVKDNKRETKTNWEKTIWHKSMHTGTDKKSGVDLIKVVVGAEDGKLNFKYYPGGNSYRAQTQEALFSWFNKTESDAVKTAVEAYLNTNKYTIGQMTFAFNSGAKEGNTGKRYIEGGFIINQGMDVSFHNIGKATTRKDGKIYEEMDAVYNYGTLRIDDDQIFIGRLYNYGTVILEDGLVNQVINRGGTFTSEGGMVGTDDFEMAADIYKKKKRTHNRTQYKASESGIKCQNGIVNIGNETGKPGSLWSGVFGSILVDAGCKVQFRNESYFLPTEDSKVASEDKTIRAVVKGRKGADGKITAGELVFSGNSSFYPIGDDDDDNLIMTKLQVSDYGIIKIKGEAVIGDTMDTTYSMLDVQQNGRLYVIGGQINSKLSIPEGVSEEDVIFGGEKTFVLDPAISTTYAKYISVPYKLKVGTVERTLQAGRNDHGSGQFYSFELDITITVSGKVEMATGGSDSSLKIEAKDGEGKDISGKAGVLDRIQITFTSPDDTLASFAGSMNANQGDCNYPQKKSTISLAKKEITVCAHDKSGEENITWTSDFVVDKDEKVSLEKSDGSNKGSNNVKVLDIRLYGGDGVWNKEASAFSYTMIKQIMNCVDKENCIGQVSTNLDQEGIKNAVNNMYRINLRIEAQKPRKENAYLAEEDQEWERRIREKDHSLPGINSAYPNRAAYWHVGIQIYIDNTNSKEDGTLAGFITGVNFADNNTFQLSTPLTVWLPLPSSLYSAMISDINKKHAVAIGADCALDQNGGIGDKCQSDTQKLTRPFLVSNFDIVDNASGKQHFMQFSTTNTFEFGTMVILYDGTVLTGICDNESIEGYYAACDCGGEDFNSCPYVVQGVYRPLTILSGEGILQTLGSNQKAKVGSRVYLGYTFDIENGYIRDEENEWKNLTYPNDPPTESDMVPDKSNEVAAYYTVPEGNTEITIKAEAKRGNYRIYYDCGNGSIDSNMIGLYEYGLFLDDDIDSGPIFKNEYYQLFETGYGTQRGIINACVLDGYNFVGWSNDQTKRTPNDIVYKPNAQIANVADPGTYSWLYAIYTKISQTRTLNIIGDEGVESIIGNGPYEVESSASIELKLKDGYSFSGWGSEELTKNEIDTLVIKNVPDDNENDNIVHFTLDMPESNVELEATTIKNKTYTVHYHCGSGQGSMDDQIISYGVSTPLSNPTACERSGYKFGGWSTVFADDMIALAEQTDYVKYNDGQEVLDIADKSQEITLYAIWDKCTDTTACQLDTTKGKLVVKAGRGIKTVGINGGAQQATPVEMTVTETSTVTIGYTVDTDNGFVFSGFGTNKVNKPNGNNQITISPQDDLTVIYVYGSYKTEKQLTIEYYINTDGYQANEEDERIELVGSVPTQTIPWLSKDERLRDIRVKSYSFDNDGSEETYKYKKFVGWSRNKNAKEGDSGILQPFDPATVESLITSTDTITDQGATITLYGVWATRIEEPNVLDLNKDGCVRDVYAEKDSFVKGTNVTIKVTPGIGCNMEGWNSKERSTNISNLITTYGLKAENEDKTVWSLVMPEQDVSMMTASSKGKYTIKYNANGGEGVMLDQPVYFAEVYSPDIATPALKPMTFTREGYTATGWSTEPNGTTVIADRTLVTSLGNHKHGDAVTLYAQWQENCSTESCSRDEKQVDVWPGNNIKAAGDSGKYNTAEKVNPWRSAYLYYNIMSGWDTNRNDDLNMTSTSSTEDGGVQTERFSFSKPNGYVRLAANASIRTYRIVYDCNGGNGAVQSHDELTYNDTVVLRDGCVHEDENYEFKGWGLSANSTDYYTVYTPVAVRTLVGEDIKRDTIVLYAIWHKKPCEGGSCVKKCNDNDCINAVAGDDNIASVTVGNTTDAKLAYEHHKAGEYVTVKATFKPGFTLDKNRTAFDPSMEYEYDENTREYTVTMPASNATITFYSYSCGTNCPSKYDVTVYAGDEGIVSVSAGQNTDYPIATDKIEGGEPFIISASFKKGFTLDTTRTVFDPSSVQVEYDGNKMVYNVKMPANNMTATLYSINCGDNCPSIYDVTVVAGDDGVESVSVGQKTDPKRATDKYEADDPVVISASFKTGYALNKDKISFDPSSVQYSYDENKGTYTLTMPASNVVATIYSYECGNECPLPSYDVTVKGHGAIESVTVGETTKPKIATQKFTETETVTVKASFSTNYTLNASRTIFNPSVQYTYDEQSRTYTFTMPAKNVTVDIYSKYCGNNCPGPYDLTVHAKNKGIASVSIEDKTDFPSVTQTFDKGASVAISATFETGYTLDETKTWFSTNTEAVYDVSTRSYTITMPANNLAVSIYSKYCGDNCPGPYDITAKKGNAGIASVTVGLDTQLTNAKGQYNAGDYVTVSASFETGYTLDETKTKLSVKNITKEYDEASHSYTIQMPASNLVVTLYSKYCGDECPGPFDLTVKGQGKGFASISIGEKTGYPVVTDVFNESDPVTVSASFETGYTLDETKTFFSIKNFTGATYNSESRTYSFKMPKNNLVMTIYSKYCGEKCPTPYDLTVKKGNEGVVSVSIGEKTDPKVVTNSFKDGDLVTISASFDTGYTLDETKTRFSISGFSGATYNSETRSYTITMPKNNLTVTLFGKKCGDDCPKPYDLTVKKGNDGVVSVSIGEKTGNEAVTDKFKDGEFITISASFDTGYTLDETKTRFSISGFSGATYNSETRSYTITMPKNNLTVTLFGKKCGNDCPAPYDLTVKGNGKGFASITIGGKQGNNPVTDKIAGGETVVVSASFDTGYTLDESKISFSKSGVSAKYNSETRSYTFTMPNSNLVVTLFSKYCGDNCPKPYDLTVQGEGGGFQYISIDGKSGKSPAKTTFQGGETVKISATFNKGYKLDSSKIRFTMDGISSSYDSSTNSFVVKLPTNNNLTVTLFSTYCGDNCEDPDPNPNCKGDECGKNCTVTKNGITLCETEEGWYVCINGICIGPVSKEQAEVCLTTGTCDITDAKGRRVVCKNYICMVCDENGVCFVCIDGRCVKCDSEQCLKCVQEGECEICDSDGNCIVCKGGICTICDKYGNCVRCFNGVCSPGTGQLMISDKSSGVAKGITIVTTLIIIGTTGYFFYRHKQKNKLKSSRIVDKWWTNIR